jgi:hypothetical protein
VLAAEEKLLGQVTANKIDKDLNANIFVTWLL